MTHTDTNLSKRQRRTRLIHEVESWVMAEKLNFVYIFYIKEEEEVNRTFIENKG